MTAYDPDLRNKFDNANPQWHPTGGVLEIGITKAGLYGFRIKGDPDTVLVYYQKEWDAFVEGVRHGEFDLAKLIAIADNHGDGVEMRHHRGLPARNPAAHSR